jgi:hypothetical protein
VRIWKRQYVFAQALAELHKVEEKDTVMVIADVTIDHWGQPGDTHNNRMPDTDYGYRK